MATVLTSPARGSNEFADIVPESTIHVCGAGRVRNFPDGYAPTTAWTATPRQSPEDDLFRVDSAEVESTWDAGIHQVPPPIGCTHSKGYWKNHADSGRRRIWLRRFCRSGW